MRDGADIDERVLEQGMAHNVRNFTMTFGRDFTFAGSQYHLEAFGKTSTLTCCSSTANSTALLLSSRKAVRSRLRIWAS